MRRAQRQTLFSVVEHQSDYSHGFSASLGRAVFVFAWTNGLERGCAPKARAGLILGPQSIVCTFS